MKRLKLIFPALKTLILIVFVPFVAKAAVLQSVQSGTTFIANPNMAVSVVLPQQVNANNSFTNFSTTTNNTNDSPVSSMVSGQMDSTGATLVFSMGAPPDITAPVTVQWYVASFASGVTVQRGTAAVTGTASNLPVTFDVPLPTPVDQTKSFPMISCQSNGAAATFSANEFVQANLIGPSPSGPTTLQLTYFDNSGDVVNVNWKVVQYDNSSVQSGITTIAATDFSLDVPLSATIDPTKSWLLFTNTTNSSADLRQGLLNGLTNMNSLMFSRGRGTNTLLTLAWYLIQFGDGTTVQNGTQSFQTTTTTLPTLLNPISLTQSIAGAGGMYYDGGDFLSNTSIYPNPAMDLLSLTSSTNLQITRASPTGSGGAEASDVAWYVVQFPLATATPSPTFTPSPTNTATVTPSPTFTMTNTLTNTFTVTPTQTFTLTPTVTPTVALALSAQASVKPASQTYLFNQTNVSSLQFILTSTANENVLVKQLAFTGGGSLGWTTDVVTGSVRLYQDASGNGLYTAGTDTLLMGGQSFDATGSVTFQNVNGVTAPLASGAPQTFLLVFDLNMSGLTSKNFSNSLAVGGITANGQTTGQGAILTGGPVAGNLHTVSAATATPTVTATFTSTSTPTFTATQTATFTPTTTSTFTPTQTATFTQTQTATFTQTQTATFTQTTTSTFTPTQTATFTPTQTSTFTPTETATFTPTATSTFTPTQTATFTRTTTATFTSTQTSTFTQTQTGTFTQTETVTFTPTQTSTFTQTTTATFTPTQTASFTPTQTLTFTQTTTSTQTATVTTTTTATVTPTVALALSAQASVKPASQTYLFNQTNVSSLQFILTSTANENVLVKQLVFTGGGNLGWTTDVVAGSVRLYQDASGNGLYTAGTDTLLMGGQSFDASGSVTFQNVNGVTAPLASGAPQTFLLVFDLDMSGLNPKNFSNSLATTGITANGQMTGQAAILSGGPVAGNLHTVSAATATPTVTATTTSTSTPTFTATQTATFTPTQTATFTPTQTATDTPTQTATYTQTTTATYTPTQTATFTQTTTATSTPTETATFTPTQTATYTQTTTATYTPTQTATFTPTQTATYTPTATATVTQTQTATFTQTTTSTQTATVTTTTTSTATPTVALALSAQAPVKPASQTYLFNQTNVSSLQFILTSTANENVLVKQLVFTGGGNLGWTTDVVAGSVRLYQDASGNGLYTAGTDTLLMGGQSFDASGSVTFQNVNGVTAPLASGAPQTFLLVFDLDMSGLNPKNFSNSLATTGITANGQMTGQAAILSGGPVAGNLHTVSAATATPTVTATTTSTSTPTFTATQTATFTPTETATFTPTTTATFTPTLTATFTPTQTATFTQTQTATFTPTETATFTPTTTATFTPTLTATFTPTQTATVTQTTTATFTPTETSTFTPTQTATFTQTTTATFTPTETATVTPTQTATFTPTQTATFTPTTTATFTPTLTVTFTPTQTSTDTSTQTATFTPTQTGTFTPTQTATFTQTTTATFTPTQTATFTQTETATFTQTTTATQTATVTATTTATATPTVALALSAQAPVKPASQNYLFNQVNVSSLQFILTSTANENVLVKQLVFTGGGSLGWTTDVVAGSVRLYQDASGNGLYTAGTDTLLMGGQSFDASGSVTFQNVNGITAPLASGAPQTFLLVFDLNMSGLASKNFSNSLAVGGITANGQTTGQAAILTGGPVAGNLHTVSAATATPTVTSTTTSTSTPTFTPTQTATFTPTETATFTPTTTATFTQTQTASFTQTQTPTSTQTQTPTLTQTQTPTFTQTQTATFTPTQTSTVTQTQTPTSTQTQTPTLTQTQTPTFTQTQTATFTPTQTSTVTQTQTSTFTQTTTSTHTPTVTLTITQTATPTITTTFTSTSTSTVTFTVTPTPTATFQPPVTLAILPPSGSTTAGPAGAPLTIEALNSSGFPATLQTALTLSLTSSSTGQNAFALTSGGAAIQTVNLLAGASAQVPVFYSDDKAGIWTLTLSGNGFTAAATPVTVIPGPYASLQVLLPGQTADPGRPAADPQGRLGNPSAASAGSGVLVTLNAVDAYFNDVVSINNPVTLTLTDLAAPAGGAIPGFSTGALAAASTDEIRRRANADERRQRTGSRRLPSGPAQG